MLIELIYYIVANLIILLPISYLLKQEKVSYLPPLFYLFFTWLFLVVGIPLANNVTVLGGYSFSYSFIYLFILFIVTTPVYIYLLIIKGGETRLQYIKSIDPDGVLGFYYFLWGVALFGVVSYIVLHGLPPLFSSITLAGSSADVYALRMSVTYGADYRRFDVFFILIPAISTLIGAYLFKIGKLSKFGFFLSILLYLVLSFSFLHKSHMIVFVLALSVVFYLFTKKNLVIFFIKPLLISTGLLLLTYIFYIGVGNYGYGELLVMIFERITLPYIVTLDFVLQNFDEDIPLLMGASFPNPKGIFDFEPIYFSNLMMNLLAGKSDGTIPAPSVGFLYANFGILGAIINSALVFLYFLLLSFLQRTLKSPVGLVIWVFLTVSVFNFSVRDPLGLIDFWVFVIIFLYFLWRFLLKCLQKRLSM